MSVPANPPFSLQDVCNEIYGHFTPPKNLIQCFTDALGTFDTRYLGSKTSLNEFRNYNNSILAPVYDYDGNFYQPIKIGTQVWLSSDFVCTHKMNGTGIYSTNSFPDLYNHSGVAAMILQGNGPTPSPGLLTAWYNAQAMADASIGIPGYRIPTYADLSTLGSYLGTSAGGHLKGTATPYDNWQSPNTGADNSTSFNGYPTGRIGPSQFYDINKYMYFWLSDIFKDNGVDYNWRWGCLTYNSAVLSYTPSLWSSYNSTTIRLIKA